MEGRLLQAGGINADPPVTCFPAHNNVQTILALKNLFALTKQNLLTMLA